MPVRYGWYNPLQDLPGIAFGYSTHWKSLKAALARHGVVEDPESPIAVSITSGACFTPAPGKLNVLYTMYECEDIPRDWIEPINKADVIVVPCRQNAELFKKYTNLPIEICWEGVDIDLFTPVRRPYRPHDFTFLWVGAPNPRKGYEHAAQAYDLFISRHPKLANYVKIYFKTTKIGDAGKLEVTGGVSMDTRILSREDLAKLYQSCDAFLLPTQGEGFGLTLAEAMATGMPSIHTPYGGTADFAGEQASYQIRWKLKDVQTYVMMSDGTYKEDLMTKCADPDIEHLVQLMEEVYFNYEEATLKGEIASQVIRQNITWDISARNFMNIVEKYANSRLLRYRW